MEQQQSLGMESIRSPAISDEISPSQSSPIPNEMLRSGCPIRISYRMPFSARELAPTEDYRYTEWNAKMHYDDHARHPFEVNTNRESNYVIHGLIRSCPGGMLVEFSCHCQHGDNPRFCNCIKDPAFHNAIMDTRRLMYNKYHKERAEERLKDPVEADKQRCTEAASRRFYDNLRIIAEAKKRNPEKVMAYLSSTAAGLLQH